jgi:hypothetical protein
VLFAPPLSELATRYALIVCSEFCVVVKETVDVKTEKQIIYGLCRIRGFQSGSYENCHLLGYSTM